MGFRVGPRRAPSRWKGTALALLVLETAGLFWAYYAFGMGDRVRAIEQSFAQGHLIPQALGTLQAALPSFMVQAVAGFLAVLGVGAGAGGLALAARALGPGLVASSGSAVVAPTYFAVRRLLHPETRDRLRAAVRGVPATPGRSTAKVLEPVG